MPLTPINNGGPPFCAFSVTAMLALRLPADCGLNWIETSQLSPTVKLEALVQRLVSRVFSEKSATGYFAPSTNEFMINYAVDDLDAFLARLKAKGVEPLKRSDDATGRFAWIVDPEGHKIELWQPPVKSATPEPAAKPKRGYDETS